MKVRIKFVRVIGSSAQFTEPAEFAILIFVLGVVSASVGLQAEMNGFLGIEYVYGIVSLTAVVVLLCLLRIKIERGPTRKERKAERMERARRQMYILTAKRETARRPRISIKM